jgi:hypothetical protein
MADAIFPPGWTVAGVLKAVVVIAALCEIVLVCIRAMGITVPDWAQKCFWIVVIAFVAIVCIHIILSLRRVERHVP